MGDSGLVHVKPDFQAVFEHTPTILSDNFRLCFGAFDDKHEVTGILAVRHSGFPLPVFSDCSTSAPLDTVIPVPAILSGFPAQVALEQILIELIEHDIRQQRRYYAALQACRGSLPLRFTAATPGGIVGFLIVSYRFNIPDRLVVHLSIHARPELRAHYKLYQ